MTADEQFTERAATEESAEDASEDAAEEPDREWEGPPDDDRDHLNDLEDGSGCTEIWEHLSERRAENDGE